MSDPPDPRVIPFGSEPAARRPIRGRSLRVGKMAAAAAVVVGGVLASIEPVPRLSWEVVTAPQQRLNADSLIATPTGFSVLGGPGPAGGMVWSTVDGTVWMSRTLPRLSNRIVLHRTGLLVVDGRQVTRIGPDGDDPVVAMDLPEAIRVGNGSKRPGLVAAIGGLVAQTVDGDVHWSADAATFERTVEASIWGADSDVTPSPADVSGVAPDRVRSSCLPVARRAPDVPPLVEVDGDTVIALIPERDPSVVWPVCEPVLWVTEDGSTWTARSSESPFPTGAYVYDLAWRQGRFVAVGGVGLDDHRVWTSLDGDEWVPVEALGSVAGVDLVEVEAGGLGWVVLGDPRDGSDPIGWFSEDGTCWEQLPEGVAARGVAVGDERIMFVEADSGVVRVGVPAGSPLVFHRCL